MMFRNFRENPQFNISQSDVNLLQSLDCGNDLVQNCRTLEYRITGSLVEELVTIHQFYIPEFEKVEFDGSFNEKCKKYALYQRKKWYEKE